MSLIHCVGYFPYQIRDLFAYHHTASGIGIDVHGSKIVSERFLIGAIQIHEHPVDVGTQMQCVRINVVKYVISIVLGFGEIDGFWYTVARKLHVHVARLPIFQGPHLYPKHDLGQFDTNAKCWVTR